VILYIEDSKKTKGKIINRTKNNIVEIELDLHDSCVTKNGRQNLDKNGNYSSETKNLLKPIKTSSKIHLRQI
jgi:hypothetical protein